MFIHRRSCILFILIRYSSVLVIVVGSMGFFYHGFTESSCHKFFLLAPIFKGPYLSSQKKGLLFILHMTSVIQTMISQLIVALRTIAVARQGLWVVWVVSIIYVVTITVSPCLLKAISLSTQIHHSSSNFSATYGTGFHSENHGAQYLFVCCFTPPCLMKPVVDTTVTVWLLDQLHVRQ